MAVLFVFIKDIVTIVGKRKNDTHNIAQIIQSSILFFVKPKLYIETTIPSYLVSAPSRDIVVAGHQQTTHLWWEKRKDDFDIFISQFIIDEASQGNPTLSKKRLDVIAPFAQLEITDDVTSLAQAILLNGIIPLKLQQTQHILQLQQFTEWIIC